MSQKGFRVATHESCTPAGEGNYQQLYDTRQGIRRLTASIKLAIIKNASDNFGCPAFLLPKYR